ncbi:hypothetical protein ACFWPU_07780 [Streptomyces sp. NPDC058471]|uniref:hypothetical protein n=1 Tax=Streptomyces sp. NPDC058471 TaxID=3346516 RepID=UPI00365BA724
MDGDGGFGGQEGSGGVVLVHQGEVRLQFDAHRRVGVVAAVPSGKVLCGAVGCLLCGAPVSRAVGCAHRRQEAGVFRDALAPDRIGGRGLGGRSRVRVGRAVDGDAVVLDAAVGVADAQTDRPALAGCRSAQRPAHAVDERLGRLRAFVQEALGVDAGVRQDDDRLVDVGGG